MKTVNTSAVKQYDGLKYSNDQYDAFWLAHLMRLGILPTGYIYPKEQRAVRVLLRRRLSLVHTAISQLISVQSQIWRSNGVRIAANELKKTTFQIPLPEGDTSLAIQAGLSVYQAVQQEINQIEHVVYNAVKLSDEFKITQTTTGIGKILGLTIMLETGDIHRLAGPGNYTSYCCCVDSTGRVTARNKAAAMPKPVTSIYLGVFRSGAFCHSF